MLKSSYRQQQQNPFIPLFKPSVVQWESSKDTQQSRWVQMPLETFWFPLFPLLNEITPSESQPACSLTHTQLIFQSSCVPLLCNSVFLCSLTGCLAAVTNNLLDSLFSDPNVCPQDLPSQSSFSRASPQNRVHPDFAHADSLHQGNTQTSSDSLSRSGVSLLDHFLFLLEFRSWYFR